MTKNTFEEAIEQLEKLVIQLGSEQNSLAKSLKIFEKGIKLATESEQQLNKIEQKVQILINNSEGNNTKDFTVNE